MKYVRMIKAGINKRQRTIRSINKKFIAQMKNLLTKDEK